MDLFRVYCISRKFMTEDHTVMISFSLMSEMYSTSGDWCPVCPPDSSYNMQIVMDVTHKCSTAAVNKHSIRSNMLDGKAAPLSFILFLASTN